MKERNRIPAAFTVSRETGQIIEVEYQEVSDEKLRKFLSGLMIKEKTADAATSAAGSDMLSRKDSHK